MDYKSCKKIPNLLKRYRRGRGLSQKQVAKILRFKSANRISLWEKGKCVPSLFNALRLSILYRTLADGLFKDLVQYLREDVFKSEAKVLGKSYD